MSKKETQTDPQEHTPNQAQAPTKPEVEKLTPEQIMAKIGEATVAGDIAEVVRLGNLLKKETKAIEDAQNAKLAKEAEELAGSRLEASKSIYQTINAKCPEIIPLLQAVKADGFNYKLDHKDKDGVMVNYKSVELMVPKPKTKKSGGGTRSAGVSTKDKTGLQLKDLIEQYANEEQKARIVEAFEKAEKSPNSAKWSMMKKVEAEILEAHPELVVG